MERVEALKESAFKRNGFDGFLVFDTANLLYFTGVSGISGLLVSGESEGTILVYEVNYEQAKHEGKNFNVELVKRGEDLMKKIAEKAVCLNMKRLAVDSLGVESWRKLSKATRGKVQLGFRGSIVAELRKTKDKTEIELIRKAADLTRIGMDTAYEVLSPGMREFEVAAEIEYAMRKRGSGGTAFDTAVSSGKHSAFPHGGCTDREIRRGDLVVFDFGAIYKNYRSDMTRTFTAGNPSEKQKRLYEIVKRAYEAAFETTRSQAKARDVDCAARRIIEEAGYGEFFVHGLGHGVGLEIHEAPILNSVSKDVLASGNVVTVEPGIYLPDFGGVRIEDTVLVEKDQAEKLTEGFYCLNTK